MINSGDSRQAPSAKQTTGVGQARNRLPAAVQRTVPFGLVMKLWPSAGTTTGHQHQDVQAARAQAPWYRAKAQPSIADMHAKLDASSSPLNFEAPTPNRPPQRKSTSCGWPGQTSRHKGESRVFRRPNNPVRATNLTAARTVVCDLAW